MSRTATGVNITDRFLRRDKRDLRKFRYMLKLRDAGLLTPRGERTLRRLQHIYIHRYGTERQEEEQLNRMSDREVSEMLRAFRIDTTEAFARLRTLIEARTHENKAEVPGT